MKNLFKTLIILSSFFVIFNGHAQTKVHPDLRYAEGELINKKANGFNGIWYMNQPSNDEYVYKYSGGLAVYCAKHQPFGVYSEKADKTFFCFGGTDDSNSTLFHNVSFFDHKTGKVANPTVIFDKKTTDAHDNPVISMDDKGYIWVFSTSHGTSRPSYISRSSKPYNIKKFEKIDATEIENGVEKPFDNFSYFQIWHVKNKGFMALFTKYRDGHRVTGFNTSKDGVKWGEWKVIGHIEMGHYQISGENKGKVSVAFNYHPDPKGLNWRTNLYYLETTDLGESWQTASGQKVQLPLTTPDNPALVKNFQAEGLNCYMKDLNFDKEGNPVVMVISSKGYESGPQNNPRKWELFHYKNNEWKNHVITTSDNNYDMGSLYIEPEGIWRIIGPTEQGPQPYNPGGEVAMWKSTDNGSSWQKVKQLTANSEKNHTYVRRPVNVHPGFYGIWADGHGRQPSKSSLYICDKEGNVFKLPEEIKKSLVTPSAVDFGK